MMAALEGLLASFGLRERTGSATGVRKVSFNYCEH